MTQPSQKRRERHFVEEAARLLGGSWTIGPDSESPDFLVTEGENQFGLEVSEIFTGQRCQGGGSVTKAAESNVQRTLNALRREYESATNTPLSVKFVGNMCADNIATVVPALIAENLAAKQIGHRVVIDEHNGLRVHATRTLRAEWFSVNDRVGWIDRWPIVQINGAINAKSKKLPIYRQNAGADIRLLIVADRIFNSGKLVLEGPPTANLHGFKVVYFFSHPESVTVFDDATSKLLGGALST